MSLWRLEDGVEIWTCDSSASSSLQVNWSVLPLCLLLLSILPFSSHAFRHVNLPAHGFGSRLINTKPLEVSDPLTMSYSRS
ncbi:hypothetical protein BDQ94DRAFT_151329 [Aspergillus welwitschiae]|uniref:Uncharacterized protein n=1 Tax=Aspergillus welwitschiae TaxID=1341132 RepID=A0A3F3PRF3_9EURO|nr:hypothetical protein BDQ94DRAFT_151329 [Aspergillus welwitschiae]RDH28896.1 hypothetical protein BDQ94DRAFT_151329 [Aspergillus welwitschiae]